jgi:hypothetical protein
LRNKLAHGLNTEVDEVFVAELLQALSPESNIIRSAFVQSYADKAGEGFGNPSDLQVSVAVIVIQLDSVLQLIRWEKEHREEIAKWAGRQVGVEMARQHLRDRAEQQDSTQ